MKAFLIDPFQKLVSEVDTDGTLEHLRSLVGVELFCITPFDDEHDIWLDDLGLTVPGRSDTQEDVQRYFVLRDDHNPRLLAGRAVLLGHTEFGDSAPATVSREVVVARIGWPTEQEQAAMVADELCKSVAMISTPAEYRSMRRRNTSIARRIAALLTTAATSDEC